MRGKYIQNHKGSNVSISLFEGNWPSAGLLNEVLRLHGIRMLDDRQSEVEGVRLEIELRLILQEGLGYHAHIHPEVGANGASVIYALGGCTNFDSKDRQCGEETEIHVSRCSCLVQF